MHNSLLNVGFTADAHRLQQATLRSAIMLRPGLQILLDEDLAVEIADDWSSSKSGSCNKSKIAIRNFHFLRRAAQLAPTGSMPHSEHPRPGFVYAEK